MHIYKGIHPVESWVTVAHLFLVNKKFKQIFVTENMPNDILNIIKSLQQTAIELRLLFSFD